MVGSTRATHYDCDIDYCCKCGHGRPFKRRRVQDPGSQHHANPRTPTRNETADANSHKLRRILAENERTKPPATSSAFSGPTNLPSQEQGPLSRRRSPRTNHISKSKITTPRRTRIHTENRDSQCGAKEDVRGFQGVDSAVSGHILEQANENPLRHTKNYEQPYDEAAEAALTAAVDLQSLLHTRVQSYSRLLLLGSWTPPPSAPRTPPEYVYEHMVDPQFGQKLQWAYESSRMRDSARRYKYGSDIAERWKQGSTPDEAREKWKETAARHRAEADEVSDSE